MTLVIGNVVCYLQKRMTVTDLQPYGYLVLTDEEGNTYNPHSSCPDIMTPSTRFLADCKQALEDDSK